MTPSKKSETPTPEKAMVKHAVDVLADLEIKFKPETFFDVSAKRVHFLLSDLPSTRAKPREVLHVVSLRYITS